MMSEYLQTEMVNKKLGIPIIVVVFVVALLAIYGLICGVECCEECRSLRRQRDEYEEVPDESMTV
jgi:hypothetical protein